MVAYIQEQLSESNRSELPFLNTSSQLVILTRVAYSLGKTVAELE